MMNVIAVMGISKTGKTSVVEALAAELRRRRYTVGSVKEIHYEEFAIDQPGTNTDRHKQAGSQLVTALGLNETDILFQEKLSINSILNFYGHDFVLLEGTRDFPCPKIITAANTHEIDELLNPSVIAISGKIANELSEYKGLPVINCLTQPSELCDLVVDKTFEKLPNFDEKCCGFCGYSCGALCERILAGESKREDCMYAASNLQLKINGESVKMVPFVEDILAVTLRGLVSLLKGYKDGATIELKLGLDKD